MNIRCKECILSPNRGAESVVGICRTGVKGGSDQRAWLDNYKILVSEGSLLVMEILPHNTSVDTGD